jgi:hypothetical protein
VAFFVLDFAGSGSGRRLDNMCRIEPAATTAV